MPKIIGVIPARWASTRFEGKILARLVDRPLIQHVWERAVDARELFRVIIACDIVPVADVCRSFGAEVVMTRPDHPSGTDRIAEAVRDIDADIVVNIQGDEPLIDPGVIDELAKALVNDDAPMATVVKKITDEADLTNPNVVKAVFAKNRRALYFSRSPIPYNRDNAPFGSQAVFKHLGLYAYRREFLMKLTSMPVSPLESAEKLEQLRVLEAGYPIKVIETDKETIGVDTREDLAKVASVLGDMT